MSDDTQETAPEAEAQASGEAAPEPSEGQEPVEGPAQESPFDPAAFKEDIMQAFRSWQGRRDQTLLQKINDMTERIESFRKQPEPQNIEMDWENPKHVFDQWKKQSDQEERALIERFRSGVITSIMSRISDDDRYVDGEEQTEFGREVVEELKAMPFPEPSMDPKVAGRLLLADAEANVVRRKLKATRKNPLSKNTPRNRTEGGVAAPAPKTAAPKVNITPELLEVARKMGYTPEEAAKLLS